MRKCEAFVCGSESIAGEILNENLDGEMRDLTHYIRPILYDDLGLVLLDEKFTAICSHDFV